MNYRIIQKRNVWLTISGAMFVIAIAALLMWGLKLGIDFTGGSLIEVKFSGTRPEVTAVENQLQSLNAGSLSVQPVGNSNMILRFQDPSREKEQAIMAKLNDMVKSDPANKLEEVQYNAVGPSIGAELKRKALLAILWVLIGIVVYISIAFAKVSKPVTSWKYGMSALIAMFHDVIITIGVFAILGKYFGIEINTPFVAAILTVLGYSVHDTIVVFDRTRENLPKSEEDFEGTVNTSVNQTLGRSINTSLTVLLTLIAIIIFGGVSVRSFALALTIGIFIGTYSSIFVASPLLVLWEKWGNRS